MILLEQLFRGLGIVNHSIIFNDVVLRTVLTCGTSLLLTLLMGNRVIAWLKQKSFGQMVRDDGPESHLVKQGTPTMGGILILFALLVSSVLWLDCTKTSSLILLFVLFSFGLVGFLDDYIKIVLGRSKGLTAKQKMLSLSAASFVVLWVLYHWHGSSQLTTLLVIPYFKHLTVQLGAWFLLLGYCVIVGSSNAVNLTDGLDGLAIFPVILVAAALAAITYVQLGHLISLHMDSILVANIREVVVFCGAIVGTGMGFLWYNAHPAEVFMGDVGALSLGALLGTIALMTGQEVLLFLMGGIFVVETLSVAIQVISFKSRGKRVFKMAPIHHHFELAGWPETKVVSRFWIMTIVLVILGLVSLKFG